MQLSWLEKMFAVMYLHLTAVTEKNYKGVEYIFLTSFTDLGLVFAGGRRHQEFGKDGCKIFFIR